MELEVLESKKNRIRFKVKGETHTFCNILRRELLKDKSTKNVGYRVEQALESEPIFLLETEDKVPKKVLLDAVGRLKKEFKELNSKLIKKV